VEGKQDGMTSCGDGGHDPTEASVVAIDNETGAAVRTTLDVGHRRGAGFTSIQ
jgi:hypothetical protein